MPCAHFVITASRSTHKRIRATTIERVELEPRNALSAFVSDHDPSIFNSHSHRVKLLSTALHTTRITLPVAESRTRYPFDKSPIHRSSPQSQYRSFPMTEHIERTRNQQEPPQSVAALLPPEILDCIFEHFDFDSSLNTAGFVRAERSNNLSNMSVVAEGWKGPARRLLCRTVVVSRRDELAEGVPEWARGGLQNVAIVGHLWDRAQTQEAASATFRILQTAPNLRLLHLSNLPFHSFSSTESTSLRKTHFLPLLRDLNVFGAGRYPHSIISDILATSNRQISRLRLYHLLRTATSISGERLDFGGICDICASRGSSRWTLFNSAASLD